MSDVVTVMTVKLHGKERIVICVIQHAKELKVVFTEVMRHRGRGVGNHYQVLCKQDVLKYCSGM